MSREHLTLCSALVCCALLVASTLAQAPTEEEMLAKRDAARSAYDQGDCNQVLSLYNAVGMVDAKYIEGTDNYRIGFCLAYLRRGDPRPYYEGAAGMLAAATQGDDAALDEHFYLVNALLNLRRPGDADAAADAAVERWESGTLLVPESDPEAWFRLGKIYRDAGQPQGALDPFSRAVSIAEDGGAALRAPYLERIARGAGEVGDSALARRAAALLEKVLGDDSASLTRLAQSQLAGGDYDGAIDPLKRAAKAPGNQGLAARYYLRLIERTREIEEWGLEPLAALPDGRSLASLNANEIQTELTAAAKEGFAALRGRAVEVPRKTGAKKPGTRAMPHPKTRDAMRAAQQRFVSLALIAAQRGYPLREYAVSGGFTPLIYHRWMKLYRQQLKGVRADQLIDILETGE